MSRIVGFSLSVLKDLLKEPVRIFHWQEQDGYGCQQANKLLLLAACRTHLNEAGHGSKLFYTCQSQHRGFLLLCNKVLSHYDSNPMCNRGFLFEGATVKQLKLKKNISKIQATCIHSKVCRPYSICAGNARVLCSAKNALIRIQGFKWKVDSCCAGSPGGLHCLAMTLW